MRLICIVKQALDRLTKSCDQCESNKRSVEAWRSCYDLANQQRDEMRVALKNAQIKWSLEAVQRQKQDAYTEIAQELNLGLPVGYVVTKEILMEKLRGMKP